VLTLPERERPTRPVRAAALVFQDPRSVELLRRLERLGPSDATVLVTGETGTGKELVARHLHDRSRRAGRPFVAVNCAALSEGLVDSELFGHERGAFTGALGAREGWFAAAQGGTLFLDEIGDLPPSVQVRLLRVLQQREIVPVGSRQPIPIDVRLIAATHVDLAAAVAAGAFREDLFYRLKVATVRVAPLRERPGDIPPLADHFLGVYGERLGLAAAAISAAALAHLSSYRWPGNVRELENAIHHALLVSEQGRIEPGDLCLSDVGDSEPLPTPAPSSSAPPVWAALEQALHAALQARLPHLHLRVEETLFATAFRHSRENQLETARVLGISRNVVRTRLARHGLLATPDRTSSTPDDGP